MSQQHTTIRKRQWQLIRLRVFERDSWRCVECGRAGRLECDHVVPLDRGGHPTDMSNLQSLCRGCHIRKTGIENMEAMNPERVRWIRKLEAETGADSGRERV